MQCNRKMISAILLLTTLAGAANACAGTGLFDRTVFSPDSGVKVELLVRGHDVHLNLSGRSGVSSSIIAVETEKALRIQIADYNFDGHKDFSISHVDDGMGTYQIYQVYVYSPNEGRFLPLTPRCGGEFINLVVNSSKKALTSSYVVDNRYRICQSRY